MKIVELEIHNIGNCQYSHMSFDMGDPRHKYPVYTTQGIKCDIFQLAIQLICSSKYDSILKLNDIASLISAGSAVFLKFSLGADENNYENDHSSDSDAPCTSQQAIERQQRRKERNNVSLVVGAKRYFGIDPDNIEYTFNNGPLLQCSVHDFHKRFFSCTDIILPTLPNLQNGNICNGRWFDLLNFNFLYIDKHEPNHLISQFCEMYKERRITLQHPLGKMTTAILFGQRSISQSQLGHLIYIFQDIRRFFEYITCFEYTVWFMLPSDFGTLKDVTEITPADTDLNLMKTKIQLKSPPSSPKYIWSEVHGYVQELFLVAVQLAFGYHCRQNVIFLHKLEKLKFHQSFEFIRTAYARKSRQSRTWIEKNYLQQIVNLCSKLKLSCVLDYSGSIPFELDDTFIIKYRKVNQLMRIFLKENVDNYESNMEKLHTEAENYFA
ncbi:orientation disruptor [Haematobia irritans]|uniref:orientation disruptor n=1 Tax=Haematobia irritans TaxID=7368 RepID=UPI003F4FAC68